MSLKRHAPTPLATALLVALAVAPPATAVEPVYAGTTAYIGDATSLDPVEVEGVQPDGYDVKRSSTATKTDMPLLDVPQAVTVVSQQQIRDQAIQSMADAVRYVPGVGAAQGEGNRDTLVFRGNTSTADLFIDGMRDDVQYYRDTYNIERIEAFKGPNAMIFGRGSPGGLLNRVTKVADWGEVRSVGLQVGSFGKRRVTADVGQPVSEDVAFRVTGVVEDSDSYRDDVTLASEGLNPTLSFRAGERTRVTLGYEYFHNDRTADRGIPSYNLPFEGTRYPVEVDRDTFFGDPDASEAWVRVNAFNALVEHEFGQDMLLRNRTRYADYDKFYQNVFPGNVNNAATTVGLSAYNNATGRQNLFNQTDLLFSASTGTLEHRIVTGLEFGRQDTTNLRNTGFFTAPFPSPCLAGSSTTNCIVPLGAANVSLPITYRNGSANGAGDADNDGVTRLAALYAQDQIEFSPNWQAVVGLRHDRFEVDLTDRRNGVPAGDRELESSDGLWSPRVGLVYKPIESVSAYASYGVTYLPRSGEQLASLAPNAQTLDPEEFVNYEIGAKWDLRDDLSATIAVYRLDRGNAAVADPLVPGQLILLDGDSQRVEGVEVSLAGRITGQWSVIASYAHQDARTTQAVGTTPEGRVLAQTPRNTASVWNRYEFSDDWSLGLGAIHRDESFASISNAVTLKGYTRIDGAVYYTVNERLSLQLNVENLFDKDYVVFAHSDTNISPGSPRAAYLSVNVNL